MEIECIQLWFNRIDIKVSSKMPPFMTFLAFLQRHLYWASYRESNKINPFINQYEFTKLNSTRFEQGDPSENELKKMLLGSATWVQQPFVPRKMLSDGSHQVAQPDPSLGFCNQIPNYFSGGMVQMACNKVAQPGLHWIVGSTGFSNLITPNLCRG